MSAHGYDDDGEPVHDCCDRCGRGSCPGSGSQGQDACTEHRHHFEYDSAGRKRCACGTYLFQHAPDHPYGAQAGPNGMSAVWCLRDDCDWRETRGGAA